MTQQRVNTTQRNLQPNRFTFTDREGSTQIAFFPQAPGPVQADDPPKASQLEYQGPEGQLTFRGNDIDKQASPLGQLITVILQPDADAGQLNLTLVLPPVNLTGTEQQDFPTIAIKTRSGGRFTTNPRPGAELAYEVLRLKGSAEAVFLPFLDKPTPDQTLRSVLEVTEINLAFPRIFPPQINIAVAGTVPSAGWTEPQLIPYTYIQAPPDGIYDFDFVANPPEEITAQVITPIKATYVWKFSPQELKGIRVHASTNSKVALLRSESPQRAVEA